MFRIVAAAIVLSGLLGCALATAAPFGATVVFPSAYIPACSSSSDMTTSFTVDVPSRLLVTVGGSTLTPDPNNGYGLNFSAQLYGPDGTTLIAQSYGNSVSVGQYEIVLADTEVLVDPSARLPYQLAPGHYTLEVLFQTSGSCEGDGPYVSTPQLTYVLLSSALDRIFANGFADTVNSLRQISRQERQTA